MPGTIIASIIVYSSKVRCMHARLFRALDDIQSCAWAAVYVYKIATCDHIHSVHGLRIYIQAGTLAF